MKGQELLKRLYKGAGLPSKEPVIGRKPQNWLDMICACDGDGECCGN